MDISIRTLEDHRKEIYEMLYSTERKLELTNSEWSALRTALELFNENIAQLQRKV